MITDMVRAGKVGLGSARATLKKPSSNANKGKNFDYQLAALVSSDPAAGKTGVARGRSPSGTLSRRQFIAAPTVTPLPVTAKVQTDQPVAAPPNPFHQPNGSIYTGGGGSSNSVPISVPTTPWAPYNGPRGDMDGVPEGGGKVTASGAPDIKQNATPVKNQYNYAGFAARNPYFTTPGNPLRPGYVLGFQNWFEENWIVGGNQRNLPMPVNKINSATQEGAMEALRLVQQVLPDAKITNSTWGEEGGPFGALKPTWQIELPNGTRINAGGVLNSYYNQGYGVTIASDNVLAQLKG